MKFSIIVVCLNAGTKLLQTIESILCQSCDDYEVIVKDGLSTDGSVEKIERNPKIKILKKQDSSIYDAMNQAIEAAKGEYFLFLNCGDYLADADVLKKIKEIMDCHRADIYYGGMKRQGQSSEIWYPRQITDFVCYRNIPCHQVCFYHRRLFAERGYDLSYPVRGDYEHFLWCKYQKNATFYGMDIVTSLYEGGGFSETKKNREQSAKEHKIITRKYIGVKCYWYRFLMMITLQPLREKIAQSSRFSGAYQKIKGILYGNRK